ncbi:DNA damage-regulated autophagy modulator protein 1-like [Dermatophagoides farinae]|uniref:DNA damage-regulated autophagy modulator protein 1-like n=1 Tax=Dermatophagoides farinae TaxID=6954 RepID=UPI003F635008
MIQKFIRGLPMLLGSMIVTFAFILWIFAIRLEQVNPIFPYISDLGLHQPVLSMFTFSLCFASLLLLLVVIIRYRLTRYYLDIYNMDLRWANYSLATGMIMVVSMCATGSIQNDKPFYLQILHNIFATILFTSVQFDILTEFLIAKQLPNQTRISNGRIIILIISMTAVILYLLTMIISFQKYPQSFANSSLRLWWSTNDPGYYWHVASSIFEWFIVIMLGPHVMTYRSLFETDIINLDEKQKCTNHNNNDGN